MDFIKTKHRQADALSQNTDATERFLIASIAGLERANEQIEAQIKELDEHRMSLNEVCSKLMSLQEKNCAIIEKYRQLLL